MYPAIGWHSTGGESTPRREQVTSKRGDADYCCVAGAGHLVAQIDRPALCVGLYRSQLRWRTAFYASRHRPISTFAPLVDEDAANGSLMRLKPVSIRWTHSPEEAVAMAGALSGPRGPAMPARYAVHDTQRHSLAATRSPRRRSPPRDRRGADARAAEGANDRPEAASEDRSGHSRQVPRAPQTSFSFLDA